MFRTRPAASSVLPHRPILICEQSAAGHARVCYPRNAVQHCHGLTGRGARHQSPAVGVSGQGRRAATIYRVTVKDAVPLPEVYSLFEPVTVALYVPMPSRLELILYWNFTMPFESVVALIATW